ncbi:hypothetical protein [Dorea amylophila]|uniref:hypothetical protein n=1 Tax=Dorea amylophila TaxID=2981789 RepID=UPI0022E2BB37|nr:hypothetical protein [Dorea amylophila]
MTEEVINKLPEELKTHICTIKKASKDNSNNICMCKSDIKVIDFDKIPKNYARGKGWRGFPKSNDALYIDVQGKWYFIEFKNGTVEKDDIYRKIYDSLIMLMEWGIIQDFNYVRENVSYILVYSEEKYGKIQWSPARKQNYNYIMNLAGQEERLFGIEKFESYLFKETHTYTQDLFENNFIKIKEQEEC